MLRSQSGWRSGETVNCWQGFHFPSWWCLDSEGFTKDPKRKLKASFFLIFAYYRNRFQTKERGFRGCCDTFPSNIHRTIDLTTFTEMENKQPALLRGSINIGFERFMETSGQQRYIWSLVYVLLKILQYFSEIAPSSEVKL